MALRHCKDYYVDSNVYDVWGLSIVFNSKIIVVEQKKKKQSKFI